MIEIQPTTLEIKEHQIQEGEVVLVYRDDQLVMRATSGKVTAPASCRMEVWPVAEAPEA